MAEIKSDVPGLVYGRDLRQTSCLKKTPFQLLTLQLSKCCKAGLYSNTIKRFENFHIDSETLSEN